MSAICEPVFAEPCSPEVGGSYSPLPRMANTKAMRKIITPTRIPIDSRSRNLYSSLQASIPTPPSLYAR